MAVTGVLVVYTVFCCRQISVPEKTARSAARQVREAKGIAGQNNSKKTTRPDPSS